MKKPIRVIIVDDSAFIRRVYRDMLESDPEIEVVGAAEDPYEAREMIKQLNPDVITLDIEMPKMDGLSFLEKIMTLRPMPVVMSSTLTQEGADETLRALELGAVEVVGKPVDVQHTVDHLHEELIAKVKAAARAHVRPLERTNADKRPQLVRQKGKPKDVVIAIGASTGGVEALARVVSKFPPQMPPIVITQHMPANFTRSFARRLDSLTPLIVKEAVSGEAIISGKIYIAPGSHHMELRKASGEKGYTIKLHEGDLVSGHRPSVDVLFRSVAESVGNKAIGAILTGMGKDGAHGLLAMRESGAITLGQNEASCVVYGMPKAAKMLGAVEKELSLDLLTTKLIEMALSG